MDTTNLIKDLQSMEIVRKRRIWKPVMEKYGFNRICEIGVYEGVNFDRMIAHNPELAIAVDSWIDDGVIGRNDGGSSQRRLDIMADSFSKRMANKPFVKIYRGYSFDVVKEFPDETFDLIYIDADHTYSGCLRDMHDWYPKLRHGGVFSGDDYVRNRSPMGVRFGVIEAVKTFLKENNIEDRFFDFPRRGWGIIKE